VVLSVWAAVGHCASLDVISQGAFEALACVATSPLATQAQCANHMNAAIL
jgi:hypothetical protein